MAGREAEKRARAAASDIGTNIEPTFDSDKISGGKTDPVDMQPGHWDDDFNYIPAEDDEPGGMGHNEGCW